jgi:phosphatidylserine/phosphatidylglycerophosphate/cardiolipin synthase-like enzyme
MKLRSADAIRHEIPGLLFGLVIICSLISGCTSTPVAADFGPRPSTLGNTIACDESRAVAGRRNCALDSALLAQFELDDNGGHRVALLENGYLALIAYVHLIRSAESSISMQTFIWTNDEVGFFVFRELLRAAERGVKVQLIADQMFTEQSVDILSWVATAHVNLEVKLYNPVGNKGDSSFPDYLVGLLFNFDNINRRMHNKLLLVDNRVGVVGGRNVSRQYFDLDASFNYLDRDVIVGGPVVSRMRESFDAYWSNPLAVPVHALWDVAANLEIAARTPFTPPPAPLGIQILDQVDRLASNPRYIAEQLQRDTFDVDDARFSADRPDKGFRRNYRADAGTLQPLRTALAQARRSIIMQTPYLVLSDPAQELVEDLRDSNPDIELIVSTNSLASTDAFYAYALSFKHKKRYVKGLGLRVHELKPNPTDAWNWAKCCPRIPGQPDASAAPSEVGDIEVLPLHSSQVRFSIHQKTLVIDDHVVVIGSHNFDPRSTVINTEAALIVRDQGFAKRVREKIARVLEPANSWLIAPVQTVPVIGHFSHLLASISRVLPVLDLWPFRYTSCFSLRPGKSTLTPGHPNFYEHYEDEGQFPAVGLSHKQITTRLVSSFGTLIEPFL